MTGLGIFFVAQLIVRGRLADVVFEVPPSTAPGLARLRVRRVLRGVPRGPGPDRLDDPRSPPVTSSPDSVRCPLLLILFRDTLLSIFANVIVTTGDLVRGMIQILGKNADGYVIDVSLNVVKVQNFDKTVAVLLPHARPGVLRQYRKP